MHVKRIHSEIIACRMCEFEAKDTEILDNHTFICEMYQCNDVECGKTFLLLKDLKSCMSEHDGLSSISHFKRHFINQECFDETFYFASDLFGKKKIRIELMVIFKKFPDLIISIFVMEKFLDKTNMSFELILVRFVLKLNKC